MGELSSVMCPWDNGIQVLALMQQVHVATKQCGLANTSYDYHDYKFTKPLAWAGLCKITKFNTCYFNYARAAQWNDELIGMTLKQP